MKISAPQRCLTVATLSLLLAATLPAGAQEETVPTEAEIQAAQPLRRLFVSDKLVINVYSEPEQAGSRVGTIETGDAVDELERGEGFVRVRLGDGREGWVGSNYLTPDAPAAVQLRDLQRQQKGASQTADKKATEEIARLKKDNDSLQTQVKELKAAAASAPDVAEEGVLEGAASGPQQLASATPASSGGPVWLWSLIVVAAAGLAYAAGYQSLARRIRKKFGGLRIY